MENLVIIQFGERLDSTVYSHVSSCCVSASFFSKCIHIVGQMEVDFSIKLTILLSCL